MIVTHERQMGATYERYVNVTHEGRMSVTDERRIIAAYESMDDCDAECVIGLGMNEWDA